MTIAEAIRLGAMLKPQAFGWSGGPMTSCAMAAASDAGYVSEKPGDLDNPIGQIVQCPVCQSSLTTSIYCRALYATIVHLNDFHCWTREAIADWLDSRHAEVPKKVGAPVETATAAPPVPDAATVGA